MRSEDMTVNDEDLHYVNMEALLTLIVDLSPDTRNRAYHEFANGANRLAANVAVLSRVHRNIKTAIQVYKARLMKRLADTNDPGNEIVLNGSKPTVKNIEAWILDDPEYNHLKDRLDAIVDDRNLYITQLELLRDGMKYIQMSIMDQINKSEEDLDVKGALRNLFSED